MKKIAKIMNNNKKNKSKTVALKCSEKRDPSLPAGMGYCKAKQRQERFYLNLEG